MKKNRCKDLLLRSMLFVPGHVDRFFDSAVKSTADALILDLEDSVPADKKGWARKTLKDKVSLRELDFPLFVRVNARETGLLEKDLEAMALPMVDGFVFPKVKNSDDIIYLENLLLKLEKQNKITPGQLSILPLIETAEAVLSVFDIAKASKRVLAIIFGHEDFLLDIQATHSISSNNLLVPRMMIVMAARATGCQPVDTPYLEIRDLQGCAEHVHKSRELGFSGMLVLHPSQIEIANKGYIPSKEEIENAEKIVALNEEARKKNRNIAFSDGKFIAPPILKQAEHVLEMSKMIRNKKKDEKK